MDNTLPHIALYLYLTYLAWAPRKGQSNVVQSCMTGELASRTTAPSGSWEDSGSESGDEDVPLAQRAARSKKSLKESSSEGDSGSDDCGESGDSDVALAKRVAVSRPVVRGRGRG